MFTTDLPGRGRRGLQRPCRSDRPGRASTRPWPDPYRQAVSGPRHPGLRRRRRRHSRYPNDGAVRREDWSDLDWKPLNERLKALVHCNRSYVTRRRTRLWDPLSTTQIVEYLQTELDQTFCDKLFDRPFRHCNALTEWSIRVPGIGFEKHFLQVPLFPCVHENHPFELVVIADSVLLGRPTELELLTSYPITRNIHSSMSI